MTKLLKPKLTGLGGNFETRDKIALNLTEEDTIDLIDVLGFALETARFILKDAAANGGGATEGVDKIKHYATLAEYFLRVTYDAVDLTDVPPRDELN